MDSLVDEVTQTGNLENCLRNIIVELKCHIKKHNLQLHFVIRQGDVGYDYIL